MKARVTILPKSGVLDPQGKAIQGALAGLGFHQVIETRQGKIIDLVLSETDRDQALAQVQDMCRKLLANPVMESFTIALIDET